MAWQLIYTSAPTGLVPGRTGFCTVARHAELRERLVTELESLSTYHRPEASSGAQALNPIISSHRIIELGGTRYHVLSRVRDASPDYTGRTNHIAHHLVCEDGEINGAVSPAQILRSFPWRKRWDDPPHYMNESVDLGQIGRPVQMPAAQWAKVRRAEDAVLLVEPGALAGCYVICGGGEEEKLLDLFDESLYLLDPTRKSPSKLWQVRFTTFVHAAENVAGLDWRGCWAGSPAHQAAERTNALRLDLTRPASLPKPQNQQLVGIAAGILPTPDVSKASVRFPAKVEPKPTFTAHVLPKPTSNKRFPGRKADNSYRPDPEELNRFLRLGKETKWPKKKILLVASGFVMLALVVVAVTFFVLTLIKRFSDRANEIKASEPDSSVSSAQPETNKPTHNEQSNPDQKFPIPSTPSATSTTNRTATTTTTPPQSHEPPSRLQPGSPHAGLEEIPKVPTYFVIGDMQQGVNVTDIFSRHGLMVNYRLQTNGILKVQHASGAFTNFPNPQQQGSKANWSSRHLYLKDLRLLKYDDASKRYSSAYSTTGPQQTALYYGSDEISGFQVIFLDTALMAEGKTPIQPITLNRDCLKESGNDGAIITLKPELALRLDFRITAESKIRLYSQNLAGFLSTVKQQGVDLSANFGKSVKPSEKFDFSSLEVNLGELKSNLAHAFSACTNDLSKMLAKEAEQPPISTILQEEPFKSAGVELLKCVGEIPGASNLSVDFLQFLNTEPAAQRGGAVTWDSYVNYIQKVCFAALSSKNFPKLGIEYSQDMGQIPPAIANPGKLIVAADKIREFSKSVTNGKATESKADAERNLEIDKLKLFKVKWKEIFTQQNLMRIEKAKSEQNQQINRAVLEAKREALQKALTGLPRDIRTVGDIYLEVGLTINGQTNWITLLSFSTSQ